MTTYSQQARVPMYDKYTGLPLRAKFDQYTGQPLGPQNSYPMSPPILLPIHQSPTRHVSQPGIEGELQRFVQPITNMAYGIPGPMGNNPAIINIDPNGIQPNTGPQFCPNCRTLTAQTIRRKIGNTAIGWGVCLWFWTGILCWMPCAMNGCKDVELVCLRCNTVKSVIAPPLFCQN